MRSIIAAGLLLSWLCAPVLADSTNKTGNVAFFQTGISGQYGLIGVLFTNYYPDSLITDKSHYSVVSVKDGHSMPVVDVIPLGPGTNINGVASRNAVGIYGTFNEAVTNKVTISLPNQPEIELTVSPLSLTTITNTNNLPPILDFIWNNGQFGILPFDGNGNGGFGLQYTLSIRNYSGLISAI